MKKLALLIFVASISTLGCAMAFGPKFQPLQVDGASSLVYVYREAQFAGSANMLIPRVVVDGEKLGSMRMGGYYAVKLKPGSHTISIAALVGGGSLGESKFDIKPGQILCFEYSETIVGFKSYGTTTVAESQSHFVAVPYDVALQNLAKTKLLLDKE